MSIYARPLSASLRLPPEIAFLVAQGFPPQIAMRAATIARAGGTDAATALLHAGLMDEETYYRALARAIGVPFLTEIRLGDETRYPSVLRVGIGPLADGAQCRHVAAPRGQNIAELIAAAARGGRLPAVTTPTRLRHAAFERHAGAIAAHAAQVLVRRHPEWSCRPGPRPLVLALAGTGAVALLVLANLPFALGLVLLAALQLATLAMLTLRLGAVAVGADAESTRVCRTVPDERLPTYTVMVALAREARVVSRLVEALARLDYPPAKLQILLLIEADDDETAAALDAERMPPYVETVVCPPGEPRTKPRALNIGLPLARGELLVVYDAEDVPDQGQLRMAAALFAQAPARTACLQGRLVVDNAGDGWLQAMFAIEYSALFDVLGPALAAWQMPIPLGGTTTHFRTRILRELCGWDAWNVTEDADLGMRLALAGYRVGDLPSATEEEAPDTPAGWLRQRTRWMKGFLQTSFTHGRRPIETWRRLGPLGGFCALTLLPATVASALVYPFFIGLSGYRLLAGGSEEVAGLLVNLTSAGSGVVFVAGLAAMVLPGALGCLRRGWHELLPLVPLLPLYFLLVSLAAWLAVIELIRGPFRWNKTEHGLSRTSRSGALHRHGRRAVTASARDRRPSRPAVARG